MAMNGDDHQTGLKSLSGDIDIYDHEAQQEDLIKMT